MNWHKYPDETPEKYGDYLTAFKIDSEWMKNVTCWVGKEYKWDGVLVERWAEIEDPEE